MPLSPILTYGQSQLQPARDPRTARMMNVNLAAGTYVRGTVLGEVTDTEADAIQTLTVTGTPTGGTTLLTGQPINSGNPSTILLPYNATAAVAQPLFDAVYGVGNTIVGGGALPGTPLTVKFTGALSAQPITAIVVTTNSLTGGSSPVLAVTTSTTGVVNVGTFAPYVHGNSDGTQVAKGILQYGCTVDASGNVTISNEWTGFTEKAVPMYYKGTFRTEELVGLPTAAQMAVDFPGAFVRIGDLTSGLLVLA